MTQHKIISATPSTRATYSQTNVQALPSTRIAVIGMGYVGLMIASSFAGTYPVVGYDISRQRIASLKAGKDAKGELSASELASSKIQFTCDPSDLANANFYILAVPTPVVDKLPNLDILLAASEEIAHYLKKGDVVVYESSVYPGATEEHCIPLLEKASGLKCGRDFGVGYSPERINPADKVNTLSTIPKIISANDERTLKILEKVYTSIIPAGVFPVSCIRAAEAAKVIENIQRDLNIGFVNEVAVILHHLNLNTAEVFAAMGTKWNHLNFRPGLVGGHCIPFNSYYLAHKAEKSGYKPKLILAARKMNESMPHYIVDAMQHELKQLGKDIKGAKIAVIGLSYKENTPDVHDTQSILLIKELKKLGAEVIVSDPVADPNTAKEVYGIDLVNIDDLANLDGVILPVAHNAIKEISSEKFKSFFGKNGVLIDVKNICQPEDFKNDKIILWQL